MDGRILTILEVSQKQAYIFLSNKLKDNIINSAVIAWVMSREYFEERIHDPAVFDPGKNYVYSGGGHVVLEFTALEKAVDFTKKITRMIYNDYPGIQVFAASLEYSNTMSPGDNLKELTKKLERKKSRRDAVFHQGTFGIERLDALRQEPVLAGKKENTMPKTEKAMDEALFPKGYDRALKFEELGGSKDGSNFIAIVHIDGNSMGARVGKVYERYGNADWDIFKGKIREFSDAIDAHFKEAYSEMTEIVVKNMENGKLDDLNIQNNKFPVRRIITAGDDICYVAEGRIGIESAVAYIKALSKKENPVDHEHYSACAGVAIVHQKYPFYKAYELAEMLCSNAKRFGAGLSADKTGKEISSVDWHIDFGELKDTLDEIREDYGFEKNGRLELRPYIVEAPKEILEKENFRQYKNFKVLISKILSNDIAYARGKIKELRPVLRRGEDAVKYYLEYNKIDDIALDGYQGIFVSIDIEHAETGRGLERKVYVVTEDGVKRSLLFDAIEMMDTYIGFED